MANVHFIWWGPHRVGLCVETPNDVMEKCKGHQVFFWCKAEEAEEFASLYLDRSIRWESCNSIKDIVGSQLYKANKDWFDNAQDVLIYLDSVKAYSAIKDLLSLVILYAYGGYYFDTTTIITPGTNGVTLNNALKTTYTAPRVPRIEGGQLHQLGLQTAMSIIFGVDGKVETSKTQYIQVVPLIDVWALYSPKEHASLLMMFMSYVSRANRMGLYPNGTPMNFDKISGGKVMKEADRNSLIGNLIIRAVYDGLLMECDGDADKLPALCWQTQATGNEKDLGRYTVPVLGINKVYRGSWRVVSVDSKDNKADSKDSKDSKSDN